MFDGNWFCIGYNRNSKTYVVQGKHLLFKAFEMQDGEKTKEQLIEESMLLRHRITELEKAESERRWAEDVLQKRTLELGERVKELDCLYGLSSLIETSGDSLEAFMQGVAELLPPAWQHPHLACARITLDRQTFSTANYKQTRWQLQRPIKVHNAQVGYLEVFYLESPLECGEETFLPQEGKLLDVVAERLGRAIERIQTRQTLRESEERFRKLFERHSAVMLVVDPDMGNIVDANEAAASFYGWSIEQLKQMHIQQINILSPEAIKNAMETARSSKGMRFEFRHRRADGSTRDVELFSNKIEIKGKALLYSIIHDITVRKQMEEEKVKLEAQNLQLQKAESLGRMAGAIAHHFNSLLGAVMGRLELALGDLHQPTRIRKHLTEALKASQRATDISCLMLTYLGQTVQRKEPCDVVESLREALLLAGPSLPQRVRVNMEFPPEAVMVQGDKAHIEQALTNLIVNAAEAIGDGDGRITVAIQVMTAEKLREFRLFPSGWEPVENSYVSVSISDTGFGIDPATMERIFDPFFSTKFTGRGLGLPVVLGIVRAHGGALAVESKSGEGSIFRVFFPLMAQQTMQPGQEPTVDFEPFKERRLVLVVEDEPVVRDMAEFILKEFGYEVIVAGDGLEALEKFRERQDEVHLVLLDQSIPGMNGWETLAALRALRSDLRAILASGYDEEQVIRGDHPEQPQAFLHKPYDLKDLEAALSAALKG